MKQPPCPQRSPATAGRSVVCPICQSKSASFFIKNLPLFRCFSCQLIFQTPTKKEEFTPNERNWGENDPRFSKATYQMKKQTFRLLFKAILSAGRPDFFEESYSEAPCCPSGLDAAEKGRPTSADKKKLLDVGTGTGALLDIALEFGFQAIGLEPDKKFVQKKGGRALRIVNSTLEKSDFKPNSFDVITMFDVLEHMQDLNSTLKKINLILKPGGLLVISTPNTNSLSFKLMGSNWPHFKKEHVYYFSPKSLQILIKKYNFTIMKIANSLKALNLEYIAGYFTAFPTPFLSPLSRLINSILPRPLTQLPIFLPNGNMLIIARKS